MPLINYEKWNPGVAALLDVQRANDIARTYAAQGYNLTLRQVYYQFVSRDFIPNNAKSYKRLGDVLNRARMAGLLDWNYITDRTRNSMSLTHWQNPAQIVAAAADGYRIDRWANQPTRVEVWVEKEALADVVGQAAERYDVTYFSCRGYVSQSEQWAAAQRLRRYIEAGQNVVILHLGDHDPSGMDMTRDIEERIRRFIYTDIYQSQRGAIGNSFQAIEESIMDDFTDGRAPFEVDRIALNFDQIQQYAPPPNFAKQTDSRFEEYQRQFGDDSWELDALEPRVLDDLIAEHIEAIRDDDLWAAREEREESEKATLARVLDRWDEVAEYLSSH